MSISYISSNKMDNLNAKIKKLRKDNKLTQEKIASILHITQGAYARWEKGVTSPSNEALAKLAEIFGVTTDYLLGTGQPIKAGVKIPVVGTIPAGVPIEAIEEILDYEEIPREWTTTGEYFGLRVKGDSMSPRILNGDVVIVRKQSDAENGDVCVVMVNGFDATLKQIKKDINGITLIPFNTKYSQMTYTNTQIEELPVRVIGKVVELRGKF